MTRTFQDFDARAAEEEPIRFRLCGKDYELPATCPAQALLKVDRMTMTLAVAEQTGTLPDDAVLDQSMTGEGMLRSLAGDELVDEWLDRGATYPQLMKVAQHLIAVYRGEDAEGNQAPPNRAARRAKKKKGQRSPSRT